MDKLDRNIAEAKEILRDCMWLIAEARGIVAGERAAQAHADEQAVAQHVEA
ncbi:hypothetical protein [Numidum massiliense]|uniref:hypothetical protein n=1 Tax=Numidum massiliense TaxID=1522315 RepID=UPI0012FC7672|nr:hypothetical protein [Numidum massiliense]